MKDNVKDENLSGSPLEFPVGDTALNGAPCADEYGSGCAHVIGSTIQGCQK